MTLSIYDKTACFSIAVVSFYDPVSLRQHYMLLIAVLLIYDPEISGQYYMLFMVTF